MREGKREWRFNLAAEKRVYKITSILPHNEDCEKKKKKLSQELQNLDHFKGRLVYII